MQEPTNSQGTQRQSLDPHGGISNGEQTPEQTTASIFFIENNTENEISKSEQTNMHNNFL